MSNDAEDEQSPVPLGRKFHFRGKELAAFSWNARTTLYRVMAERTPVIEEYTYLIYLLANKTPAQMDAIRSEEAIAAFRIEAGEWANREKLGGGKGWEELLKVATDIVENTRKAEAIEVVPEKGGKKRAGNS